MDFAAPYIAPRRRAIFAISCCRTAVICRNAEAANRHGYTKHGPALPLYAQRDAEETLRYFQSVPFDCAQAIRGETMLRFMVAGHILGAASVQIECSGRVVAFSGPLEGISMLSYSTLFLYVMLPI